MKIAHYISRTALVIAMSTIIYGCSTTEFDHPSDPLEKVNRVTMDLNDVVDDLVLTPAARGYKLATPDPVENCISNIFNTIKEPMRMGASIFTLDQIGFTTSSTRFALNSTVGFFGCLDVAGGALKLKTSKQELALVTRYWNDDDGIYLVVPLLGPSTPGSLSGSFLAAAYFDPMRFSRNCVNGRQRPGPRDTRTWVRNTTFNIRHAVTRKHIYIVRALSTRASYLEATDLVDEIAFDSYSFIRDAYFDSRTATVEELRLRPDY